MALVFGWRWIVAQRTEVSANIDVVNVAAPQRLLDVKYRDAIDLVSSLRYGD
jgi:hypothetical protein